MSAPSLQIFNESMTELPFSEEEALFVLKHIEDSHHIRFEFVELVYVDEKQIVEINTRHLSRDYVTDIISFRYDEEPDNQSIEGTLFCCSPRITEQAKEFNEPEKREFLRVFIHGLLHLEGYEDDTVEKKAEMTRLEDFFLLKSE
ncbi:MAG: rRNA maturation RNase YbeY [Bacteroidota bacterium]